MGTPRIYYYPESGGTLEEIDLGEELSDLTETPGAEVEDAVSFDGYFSRNLTRATYKVRLYLERFGTIGGSSLERKLKTLEAHLFAGGFIGFTRDETKAYASLSGGAVSRGQSLFYGAQNGFSNWASSAIPAEGDEVVMESAGVGARREYTTVSAFTAGQVTLADSARYTHPGAPMLRHRDFYPVLYLAKEDLRPTTSHDHRRNWTWELTLTYAPAMALALLDGKSAVLAGNAAADARLASIETSLAARIKTFVTNYGDDIMRESASSYQRVTSGAFDPRLRGL